MAVSNIDTYQLSIGNPNSLATYTQVPPDTATTSATLTTSQIRKGLLLVNQGGGAGTTLTFPSGTVMDAAFPNIPVNGCFNLEVVNISTNASEDATFAGGTGWTTYGCLVVASNSSASEKSCGVFKLVRSGVGTWNLFRISS